ncbi:MAG: NAD-dependent epimerase/dehydratase family protein [Bacteroidota bacterium]|nr:NAD-dependent epimerase/dehydratase family protein [Bacteroidota bacterium]
MQFKVIITGATGMVGEGVVQECLDHRDVKQVLMVNRRPSQLRHPKLKECIVPDFFNLENVLQQLEGYDACFYCAGISSRGMDESAYTVATYDTTMSFAKTLQKANPDMIFCYVSGNLTDSTEKGRLMWARVKGKTENALMELPFKKVYNFRPGFMKPNNGQKNIKTYYKIIGSLYPILRLIAPNQVSTMHQVGLAIINSVLFGYEKAILEIEDIKLLAKSA